MELTTEHYPNFFEEFEPTLIGGAPVMPGEYPEVVYIRNGGAACTGAIIGPYVLLTVAHCTDNNGGRISFQLGQTLFTGKCTQAPGWPDLDRDLSLCKLDRFAQTKYATLAVDGPRRGDLVTLIGYGCTRPGGGGGNDGILRVGESKVTDLPGSIRNRPLDFVTRQDAALCFGDSGGPAFARVFNPKDERHQIIGVNSRGDIESVSLLAATYVDFSTDFIRTWLVDNEVAACGVNLDCEDPAEPPSTRCLDEMSERDLGDFFLEEGGTTCEPS